MSREDWASFRHDPRYSEERVVQIYRENKGRIDPAGLAGQLKMLTDECNCWVEPDNTYITEDPVDWTICDDFAGGEGVDCWMGPISLPFSFCFLLFRIFTKSCSSRSSTSIFRSIFIFFIFLNKHPAHTANKIAGLRPAMLTESKTAGCGAATPAVECSK